MSQPQSLDELARDYEEDLRYLIYQVSSKDYESLINSFYILTDLFCLIQKLEKLEQCRVNVPSPTDITNPTVLEQLHIDPAEKRKVREFLRYIENNKGTNFEQLISDRMKEYDCDPEAARSKLRAAGA